MKVNTSHRQSGFTLTEMMVSIAIFMICLTMALGAFFVAYKITFFTRMLEFAHSDVRNATDRIAVLTRQSLYYPQVYSNGIISPHTVNVMDGGGSNLQYVNTVGNEVRLLYEGAITRINSTVTPSSTTLVIENNAAFTAVSTIPTVFGTITPSANVSNNPVRLVEDNYQIQPGDSLIIDASSAIAANVTNTVVTPSNIVLQLDAPLATASAINAGTSVFIGRMGRLLLTNSEMRFYPLASNPNNFDVLVQNVTTDMPFGISGPMLTIDLKYTSPGDITGKGIYRIITRSTMRTDPKLRSNNYIATGGLNTAPNAGMGDN